MNSNTDGNDDLSNTGHHLIGNELRAWTTLLDASRILDTELEADLAQHGMTHREYEVLVRLDGYGGRMRMSALAAQIEASSPLVSQTVARLEGRGWVEREPAADDGRGVEAVLTSTGSEALRTAAKPHAALLRELLIEPLGDDLPAVAEALSRAADHLRSHRRDGDCDDPTCSLNQH